MAVEYSLKIRDGIIDDRVRDLLIEGCPALVVLEDHNENLCFDLESDLLFVWGRYDPPDRFRDLGGYSLESNSLVWFRHKKHDTPAAALQMLRCVLHLIDHMDNDMVLLWQGEKAVLARAGGELILNEDAAFWQIPARLAMLEGRPYRVARMKL